MIFVSIVKSLSVHCGYMKGAKNKHYAHNGSTMFTMVNGSLRSLTFSHKGTLTSVQE